MQTISALYRLAVSLWCGGVTLFTLILTPMLFKSLSRDQAGQIVGILFPGYFKFGLACGAVALACRLLQRNGTLLPILLIVAMVALTSFQSFYLEPRASELKRQIPSFESTPKDHPLRREFSRLHGISAACNLVVMGGGVVLVILL